MSVPELKLINPDQIPEENPNIIIDTVMRAYDEAKQAKVRKQAESLWKEAENLVWGDQWEGISLENWRAKIEINRVWPVIEKYMSVVLGQRPTVQLLPRDPNDTEIAEAIDAFFNYLWESQNWMHVIGDAVEKSLIRRVGFIKTYFDLHAANGLGLPEIEPVSAWDLYLHPQATIRNGELRTQYAIHRMNKTREEIINTYQVDVEAKRQIRDTSNSRYTKRSYKEDVDFQWGRGL